MRTPGNASTSPSVSASWSRSRSWANPRFSLPLGGRAIDKKPVRVLTELTVVDDLNVERTDLEPGHGFLLCLDLEPEHGFLLRSGLRPVWPTEQIGQRRASLRDEV